MLAHLRPVIALIAVCAFAGCSQPEPSADPSGGTSGHSHHAPHGGVLVELGDHEFSVELLRDRATGTLQAFILDGHAAQAVRIEAGGFVVEVDRSGSTETLELWAVENALSNETVGNTSEFAGRADWLKEPTVVTGRIRALAVRGTTYRDVPFVLP